MRFLNRKEESPKGYTGTAVKLWKPGKNSGICSKHYEDYFLKVGKRTTLRWELNPIPIIYPDTILPSLLPIPTTSRRPPLKRTLDVDESVAFKQSDILTFKTLHENCSEGYQVLREDHKIMFIELENMKNS